MRQWFLVGYRMLLLVGILAVLVVVPAPTAHAGGEGEPIHGDLNRDGHPDRTTLTQLTDRQCGVRVEYGGVGGYRPAVSHRYQLPPDAGTEYCPDMGVVFDVAGDGVMDLVLGFFWGTQDFDLIVLRDFQPVRTFTNSLLQPSHFGLADFNGDGMTDMYVWGPQHLSFITLLNTRRGDLVRGPVQASASMYCRQYWLPDLDGDGATDLVFHHDEAVTVVLDDGRRSVPLDLADDGWIADIEVSDANRDRRPDVLVRLGYWDGTEEERRYLTRPNGTLILAPLALNDIVPFRRDRWSPLRVRANDLASSDAAVTIVTPPRYGQVAVTSAGDLVYRRTAADDRHDVVVYRLQERGRSDDATVTIRAAA